MAIDLNLLSNNTVSAIALSNLILVTPENKGIQAQSKVSPLAPQPKKFLFNYEGEQIVSLESDITDHYTEENSAINDQIALKPETFQTSGFIGELNNVVPEALKPLRIAADKARIISAYTPALTVTAENAYNNALQAYQIQSLLLGQAVSSWSSINGQQFEVTGNETAEELEQLRQRASTTQNKQQLAFQEFYGYWRSRTLFTVQTPWAVFKNMAIMNLRAVQSAQTRVITNFEVTFKIMRFARTTRTVNEDLDSRLSERVKNQQTGQLESFKNLTPDATTFTSQIA